MTIPCDQRAEPFAVADIPQLSIALEAILETVQEPHDAVDLFLVPGAVSQALLQMKRSHAVHVFGFHQQLQMAVVGPSVAVTAAMVMVDSATKVGDSFPDSGKE